MPNFPREGSARPSFAPILRAGAREGHDVDVGGREVALLEKGVDGQAWIAGVVLQAGEALFGGAAHDAAVPKDGRRGAVCFVDAEDDHVPGIITFRSSYAVLLRDLTISRQKAGMSSGLREVMRLPSTTTSSSTHWAPALTISSLMEKKEVAFLPLRIPALASIHPAWQMAATTLPCWEASRTSFTMLSWRRIMSGA